MKKKWLYGVVCLATAMSLSGCSLVDKAKATVDKTDPSVQVVEVENKSTVVPVKEVRKQIKGEWSFLELVETEHPWLYVQNITAIKEFAPLNEGGATYDKSNNLLKFGLTRADNLKGQTAKEGLSDAAVEGAYVYAEIDTILKSVIVKEFKASPESTGGELIELSDERLVEIGLYFLDIIEKNI